MLPFIKRQGNTVVLRSGAEPSKALVKAHAVVQRADARPDTWRKALGKLTNNGADIHLVLINLMHGNAYRPQVLDEKGNPTGQVMELVVPTPEVRRAASMNLHEMLHGKAVPETEVRIAEAEASKKVQLESMTDAELEKYIEGEYKLLPEGVTTAPREDGTHDEPERVATPEGREHGTPLRPRR
jgi:hypothetical protein